MTEMLRTQLERAADLDFAAVDLGAITTAGDRRIRGRRRGLFAGAVVALVLACGAPMLVAGRGDDDRVVDLPNSAPAGITWVVGDTLHTTTASYDLGHRVRAFVRTDVGYAVLTPDGEIYSYVDGDVRRIADGAGQTFLVSDPENSWVGWVDESGATPAVVAHDLASGRTRRHDVQAEARGADEEVVVLTWLLGIDDGTAYWIDLRGTVAGDLETGATTVLPVPGPERWVSGVRDGFQVRLVETPSGGDLGSEVVDRNGKVVLPVKKDRYFGAISPGARWITTDGPVVVELGSGRQFPLQIGSSRDVLAYEWLDGDTVAAFRENDDAVDLLTCEVETGACTVAAEGLPAMDGELVVPGSSGFFGFG